MKSLIHTLKKRDIKILDRCTNLILSYSYKGLVFSYHRRGGWAVGNKWFSGETEGGSVVANKV